MRHRPIVVSLCVASLFSLAGGVDAQTARPRAATTAKPAQEAGWLANPIREHPSPDIVSLKGAGTANAVAEARMAPKAIEAHCSENARVYTNAAACMKQLQAEYGKTLRATADCTVGRITTTADLTYTLDGLWDNSDIGGGRTRWRNSDGVVVGRGLADNGLYVSQQWETLCPAPVTAAFIARATQAAAAAQVRPAAQNPPICGGEPLCTEVNDFAVTIVDFRASLAAPRKVLTVSYRFENKTTRPIVLGYLPGSGVAIDERGNRYASVDTDVRGIGLITRTVDAKFVLQPGQRSDARLTYYWDGGRTAYGTTFDAELTVREIRDLGNNKVDLGAEYPLRFAGLVDGARPGMSSPASSSSAAPPAPAPVASAPAAVPTERVDNCAGVRNPCHDAGPFSTTVTGFSGSIYGNRHHILRVQLTIRNHSDLPLVLAYKSGTNSGVDNLGNAYGWGRPGTHDGSAQGIGLLIPGRSSDSQFRLAPGASRNAVVTVTRFESGPTPQGQSFTLDTVLAELRILPNGNQTEIVREHSVHLTGLTLGGRAVGTGTGSGDEAAERIKKAGEAIRGIFGGKK
jgi:hypothetical protein